MSGSSSLEKAYIEIQNGSAAGTKIKCAFNPQEYQIRKSVEYDEHKTLLDVPVKQFTGGVADTLSMELFFDTTKDETDVTNKTGALDQLLEVDGQIHAPPYCRFVWGGGIDFQAFVIDTNKRFTKFLPDGTPVRAWVDVTFEQYKKAEQQKSSIKHESTDKMKLWTVSEDDTLWLIAEEEYGDTAHWRTIAEANDIENPRNLEAGTKLSLPPL